MPKTRIRIAEQYCGPPSSGNGGYTCGLLAKRIGGDAIVRLHVPPPLEAELEVQASIDSATLMSEGVLVAEARTATIDLDLPEPPSFDQATIASRGYRGFQGHWYPSCFVCGPDRSEGDGLCIYPGPVEGRDLVAAPWIPDASLGANGGDVAPEFLWAALDCPGAFSFPEPTERAVLLGELQVSLIADVSTGERCVVMAWELAHEGRKHKTGTAIFGESGDCRGVGIGTWIEVPLPTPPSATPK
jgi:hypothetical protein